MNKNRLFQFLSYVFVAVMTATITVAVILFSGVGAVGNSKLQQLEDLILDRYVEDVDQTKLEDAAASAMIGALGDRWSYYLTAEQYASHYEQEQNAYVGIGVAIDAQNYQDGMRVLSVTAGGPAEEAGMLAQDLIVGVDGQNIVGMELDTVQSMIKGKENTTVELKILRGGKELTLTVTRRTIHTPVATAQMLKDNIGLVTIVNFNANCAKETIAAIEQLREDGAEKLIFDVRNNPGGYVSELVKVLDHLLPEGVVFRSEDSNGKTDEETSDAKCLEMPMAVIVNGNSYSAAEFFAAALSEKDWATVIGEQTSGKGYYQVMYRLSDGSAVGLSVDKYCTAGGKSLEGVGITPNVMAPVDESTAAAIYAGALKPEEDPQIQAAVNALKGK